MSFPGGGRAPQQILAHGRARPTPSTRWRAVTRPRSISGPSRATPCAIRRAVPDRATNPDEEVAEIAVLAVGDLIDRANYESERRDHPQYGEIRLHFFHVDGYTVWGATGRMLVQLLELTTDWRVPPEPDRSGAGRRFAAERARRS